MKKIPYAFPLLLILLAILFSPGCKTYNEVDLYPACDTNTVSYSHNIQPVFLANCMPCHSINNRFSGINLDLLDSARIPARSGQLLKAVTHDPSVVPMPRGGPKLSDCNIALIRKWINLGEPAK